MKIIKAGSVDEVKENQYKQAVGWSKEIKCGKCGSIFEINVNDLAAYFYDDYYSFRFFCPVCEAAFCKDKFALDIQCDNDGLWFIAAIITQNRKKFKSLCMKHKISQNDGKHASKHFKELLERADVYLERSRNL